MREFNGQELANTSWAFATVRQLNKKLFIAFAMKAQLAVRDFDEQDLSNTA